MYTLTFRRDNPSTVENPGVATVTSADGRILGTVEEQPDNTWTAIDQLGIVQGTLQPSAVLAADGLEAKDEQRRLTVDIADTIYEDQSRVYIKNGNFAGAVYFTGGNWRVAVTSGSAFPNLYENPDVAEAFLLHFKLTSA